jgi:hypothetical protein
VDVPEIVDAADGRSLSEWRGLIGRQVTVMHRTKLMSSRAASASRREVLGGMSAVSLAAVLSITTAARGGATGIDGDRKVAGIKTRDGTEIFYKDWGPKTARPIVFHHGWPQSAI